MKKPGNGYRAIFSANPGFASLVLSFITALYLTVVFNRHILLLVIQDNPVAHSGNLLFVASVFITLLAFLWLVVELPSIGKARMWWPITLLLIAAITDHARKTWNIIYDETMIRNIIETDVAESREMLSMNWLFYVGLAGLLPALAIGKMQLPKEKFQYVLIRKTVFFACMAVIICLSILPFYQNYASLMRTHRHLREMVIPSGFLHSSYKYASNSLPQFNHPLVAVGVDARFNQAITTGKKVVLVIVAGETARTANFSLAGYTRNTNPLLAKRLADGKDTVFFPQFFSCGTTTAISLPCMFSSSGRENFDVDASEYTENLLDVFSHAGFNVIWIDNNSGCKGTCARVQYSELRNKKARTGCNIYGCDDLILVEELDKTLQQLQGNTVIVLHQKGSHGPSYFEHVPADKQQFKPVCHSRQLPECTPGEITNSYDNTILYTDTVLDRIISTLEHSDAAIIPAMFYASDHGESLGEHKLYLHGMPWSIAPDEQKHIPALLWLSPRFSEAFNVDMLCLRDRAGEIYSHDHIFHSMIGLLNISTSIYNQNRDLVNPCQKLDNVYKNKTLNPDNAAQGSSIKIKSHLVNMEQ